MTTSNQEADAPPFQIIGSTRQFSGQILKVRVDTVRDEHGNVAEREVVEHGGAVAAVVVDTEGHVLLVRQWRQAPGRYVLEIPAGKYDVAGESIEDALSRELQEELGVEGGRISWLTSFLTTAGWSDEIVDLYLVDGVRRSEGGRPSGEWEEATMEVLAVSFDEALELSTRGEVGDAKTVVGLALYALFRSGSWRPDPAGRPRPDAPASRQSARSARTGG